LCINCSISLYRFFLKEQISMSTSDKIDVIPIYIALPPENIVQLKNTLESYEGLAITRTLNASRGEVVLLALPDTVETVKQLLESLKDELNFRIMEVPEGMNEDWLLADIES